MHTAMRFGAAAAAAVTAGGLWAGTASAAEHGDPCGCRGIGQAVFVQTDDVNRNQVVAYQRGEDGRLARLATYDTGGRGGVLDGSVVDHLASQGSLTYDAGHGLLYAVNAGSDTVSVFDVQGDRLQLRQVVTSGGAFPVSIAVHEDVVYVLNALDGGSVQGYTVEDGRLRPQHEWHRALGLDPHAVPQFTNTPGQVGFADWGRKLVVTTKANGSDVDVFAIDDAGSPASTPVVTNMPGAVPFAFTSDDRAGRLYLAEAGTNSVASFTLHPDGTLTPVQAAATGQAATCWITAVGDRLYVSNAGSATVSGYHADPRGGLGPISTTSTDPGTVDSAASRDGRFLYVQTGGQGIVDEFAVGRDGTLTKIGSELVPNAVGGEGIVAS